MVENLNKTKLHIQKTIGTIISHHARDITESNNFSNIFLTKDEIEILKLGLSFTPTPKHNISELETDIYNFIRKLRLTYHFRDSTYEDISIVKNESTFTPKNNENQELETICKNLSETKINIKRISDNMPNLRDGLNSLKLDYMKL